MEAFDEKIIFYKVPTFRVLLLFAAACVKDALKTMQLKNIRRLSIVEKEGSDNIIGIITDKDLFRNILRNQNLIPSLLGDAIANTKKYLHCKK